LLIGVADDGTVTGIEADYATLSRGDRDGYERFIIQLISDRISGPSQTLCRISFNNVEGKDVCRVDVSASSKPVFACPENSKEFTDFWVRQRNRTDQLYGSELLEYKEDHWD